MLATNDSKVFEKTVKYKENLKENLKANLDLQKEKFKFRVS